MQKKTTTTTNDNPWDSEDQGFDSEPMDSIKPTKPVKAKPIQEAQYDMEGLMNDFPTAKELERFVYDETGLVLNLKGRANKLKYQVAMDALNNQTVDPQFLGRENPYLEKTEMVPVEDLKPEPARDATLPDRDQVQNSFVCRFVPHPNEDFRAQDRKVDCVFRKYRNGMISYEVVGPLDTVPHGEKQDKFGRVRPEVIKWVDPRTGEQTAVRKDGTLTPMGRNLRALMQKMRVNNSNWWEVWVDREFAELEHGELANPWDIEQ